MEIKYYRAHEKKLVPGSRYFVSERNTPLPQSEIPPALLAALNHTSQGNFPTYEAALNNLGVKIPDSMTVANFLSLSCVAVANVSRRKLELPESDPAEVRLIVDNYFHEVGIATGNNDVKGGYRALGFEVVFEDNEVFNGAVRMPGYSAKRFWGIPRYCVPNVVSRLYDEDVLGFVENHQLFNERSEPTPQGMYAINFIAKTIRQTS